jgi:outer membrane protein OmpA-like peptidoglycan-associated protein
MAGRVSLVLVLLGAGAAGAQAETPGAPAERSWSVVGVVKVEVEAPPAARPPPAETPAPTFEPVYFSSRGETVQPASRAALDAVASALQSHPGIRLLRIEAHTDGMVSRNARLSQRRAEWVRAYLVRRGVAPERLVAKGFGASRPSASDQTPEGRQLNRRVEFIVEK